MRIYTLALSILAHVAAVIAVIVVPLVATDVLPESRRPVEFRHVVPVRIEPPLPVPVPPPATPREPLRVGGSISRPERVHYEAPVYPAIARAARVEGVVIFEAVLGIDGMVRDARVLRSVPLLDAAALEAVRQWQFRPTLLNGEAVPVVMTVTVVCSLR